MAVFAIYQVIIAFILSSSTLVHCAVDLQIEHYKAPRQNLQLPPADGKLHIYSLPVGQGDAQVIQCPSGDLGLVDFGSNQWPNRNPEDERFWGMADIMEFFGSQTDLIHSITVTHNHWDHYSLLPDTFPDCGDLPGLEHLYISCTPNDMATDLGNWVRDTMLENQVKMFNGGNTCGPNGVACESIDLCPNDPEVSTFVMSVNLGNHCTDSGNKNIDSVVFKVIMGDVSIMLNGDFEDETSDWNEDGPQKQMVDYYGDDMKVTVYKLAHHGASFRANKPVFRDAVAPRAVFFSANTEYWYRHPRCVVIDAFINVVQPPLCQPEETNPSSPNYCGEHIWNGLSREELIQSEFMCGTRSANPPEYREDNIYAVFTTTPTPDTLNLLQFSTDGHKWGFRNNMIDT